MEIVLGHFYSHKVPAILSKYVCFDREKGEIVGHSGLYALLFFATWFILALVWISSKKFK